MSRTPVRVLLTLHKYKFFPFRICKGMRLHSKGVDLHPEVHRDLNDDDDDDDGVLCAGKVDGSRVFVRSSGLFLDIWGSVSEE